jgi:hypothetical protein
VPPLIVSLGGKIFDLSQDFFAVAPETFENAAAQSATIAVLGKIARVVDDNFATVFNRDAIAVDPTILRWLQVQLPSHSLPPRSVRCLAIAVSARNCFPQLSFAEGSAVAAVPWQQPCQSRIVG